LSTAAALGGVGLWKHFQSKEAQDEFLKSDEGKAFLSKLASFEKRDEEEEVSHSIMKSLNAKRADFVHLLPFFCFTFTAVYFYF